MTPQQRHTIYHHLAWLNYAAAQERHMVDIVVAAHFVNSPWVPTTEKNMPKTAMREIVAKSSS